MMWRDKPLRLTIFNTAFPIIYKAVEGKSLGRFDRLRRKKKAEVKGTSQALVEPKPVSFLEKICGDDKETYEALQNTLILDPKKVDVSIKDAAEAAKKYEKNKDTLRAVVMYRLAGGLALHEGNVERVVEYFTEAQRLQPKEKFTILKVPDKAVEKAQEYYKQVGKPASTGT
jgi:hypothetical protein